MNGSTLAINMIHRVFDFIIISASSKEEFAHNSHLQTAVSLLREDYDAALEHLDVHPPTNLIETIHQIGVAWVLDHWPQRSIPFTKGIYAALGWLHLLKKQIILEALLLETMGKQTQRFVPCFNKPCDGCGKPVAFGYGFSNNSDGVYHDRCWMVRHESRAGSVAGNPIKRSTATP